MHKHLLLVVRDEHNQKLLKDQFEEHLSDHLH